MLRAKMISWAITFHHGTCVSVQEELRSETIQLQATDVNGAFKPVLCQKVIKCQKLFLCSFYV